MEGFTLQSQFLEEAKKRKFAKDSGTSPQTLETTKNVAGAANSIAQATGAGGAGDTSTAGNAISGAASGAAAGAQLGPQAAAIGGIVGGAAGAISAGAKKKKEERELEAQATRNKGAIEQNAGQARSNAIQNLASSISQSLLRR